MGLRQFLPALELLGGGGGAGLGFCIFPLSPGCLCLRALHSSPAAPKAGNTLGLRSSAWRALVLEFSNPVPPGLLTVLGVNT